MDFSRCALSGRYYGGSEKKLGIIPQHLHDGLIFILIQLPVLIQSTLTHIVEGHKLRPLYVEIPAGHHLLLFVIAQIGLLGRKTQRRKHMGANIF